MFSYHVIIHQFFFILSIYSQATAMNHRGLVVSRPTSLLEVARTLKYRQPRSDLGMNLASMTCIFHTYIHHTIHRLSYRMNFIGLCAGGSRSSICMDMSCYTAIYPCPYLRLPRCLTCQPNVDSRGDTLYILGEHDKQFLADGLRHAYCLLHSSQVLK